MKPAKKPQAEAESDWSNAGGKTFPPNTEYFLEIIGSQRAGLSALPWRLGLEEIEFERLLNRHLAGIKRISKLSKTRNEEDVRQQLLDLRESEKNEIEELLLENRSNNDESEKWLSTIIASACMGGNHLWRDLGLSSRDSLKRLMRENFPQLATKNNRDMRWKKFLYRQLCEKGGHFLCRSPSCDTCPTFDECFGEEL